MNPGSLVIKSSRWEPDSRNIGVIIQESDEPDSWVVMWTKKGSYRLQVHLESALIELNGVNDDLFLERTCTSK
jgi:hypothetical protein